MDIPIIYRRNYNNNNYIIVLLRLFVSVILLCTSNNISYGSIVQTPTNGGSMPANINADNSLEEHAGAAAALAAALASAAAVANDDEDINKSFSAGKTGGKIDHVHTKEYNTNNNNIPPITTEQEQVSDDDNSNNKNENILNHDDIATTTATTTTTTTTLSSDNNNNNIQDTNKIQEKEIKSSDETAVMVTEEENNDDYDDDGYVYLPTKEHAEYPIEPLSKESLVAGGVEMPQIFFTSPNEGEILKSSDVLVGLAIEPENTNLMERNIVMCLELLFRHGKQRSCFNDITDVEMSGLEGGQLLAIATLELNATLDGRVQGQIISKDTRSINVIVDVKPAKVGITFPRTEEHLSVQYVGVAVRLDGFEKDDGIVCMTISKDIHVNEQGMVTHVGESTDQCLKPMRKEIVVSTNFPEGLNGVSAQLYSMDGTPLGKRGTMTQTWFRVTPSSSLPRPKMGLITYWDSCMEEDPTTGIPINTNIPGKFLPALDATDEYPVVHIGVLSARSYDRYDEAMVMIKSILFNRKRPNILHFHLIVDPAGRIFFTENFVALKLPGLRISFYDFQQVCVKPNERLLKKFNFTQSAHYSGHAGYCRLYMYRYLKNIPGVDGLIAVESDQIFLEDVVELWNEFNNFPTNAMIGMPEIYKPWGAGRNQPSVNDLTDGKINGVEDKVNNEDADLDDDRNNNNNNKKKPETNTVKMIMKNKYHGNGFIGGIVMLNFKRMGRGDGWQDLVEKSITKYIKMKDDLEVEVESWNPQMNDQDIFNSIFSLHPELVYPLPCQYNIQFHAFQEHLRTCGMDTTKNIECDEAKKVGMFLCKRRPAIVHFMAQSYRDQGAMGKSYYSGFWQAMKQLNPDMLKYDFLERMCV